MKSVRISDQLIFQAKKIMDHKRKQERKREERELRERKERIHKAREAQEKARKVHMVSVQLARLSILRPRQNGHHFADKIFECSF